MISRINGQLEAIDQGAAQITTESGLTYAVLLPAFLAVRLTEQIGQPITLHTFHFVEGSAQGATMYPRLAGFTTQQERAFFELFITVKGIGPRKALRALGLETGQIAGAIADRDAKLLQSLPEIGKRMSETIIATLHGRVDGFVSALAYPGAAGGGLASGGAAADPQRQVAREALEVLLQLGEQRAMAIQWIDRVLYQQQEIEDPQELIREVLRLKSGG